MTRPTAATALRQRFADAGLDWIVPAWPVPETVGAFFTTRTGGIATGARASFDLGGPGAADDAVRENRRRLRAYLPGDPHWLSQVHGARVLTISRAVPQAAWPEADAAVTACPGAVCAVRVADCLPVLLADGQGRAVGVAHAGWRGLAGGVLEASVAALRALGSRDERAWLGPAIGPAAFEVGDEVRAAFVDHDAEAQVHFARGAAGKWWADLHGLARQRLARAGVMHVTGGLWCTRSEAARFFSHRRDPATGRMAACIWIDPGAAASV